MKRDAIFSEDGVYRYTLSREWDHRLPIVNFVSLNPSKADAYKDDQTARRYTGFAARWGYGGWVGTNLYAYCSTIPKYLWSVIDPVGPENDKYIILVAHKVKTVVCSWGANATLERAEDVRRLLLQTRDGVHVPNVLYCFGKTKTGEPRHPLRLSAATELREM